MTTFRPYCPQCASVLPDDMTFVFCMPCGKGGHVEKLTTVENRQASIDLWKSFYDWHNYTEKERSSIPAWVNLNNIPADALLLPAIEQEQTNDGQFTS